MLFKTRAEHVLAALKQIEATVSEDTAKFLSGGFDHPGYDEIFRRRLNHAVQLFCADQLSDELRPVSNDV